MEPETVEEVLALLQERPNDVELYQKLGGLYLHQREILKSWEAYMQALRIDPDDPFTCMYFGNLLATFDDKKWAWQLYRRAAELAPKLAIVHWLQGALHRKERNFDGAELEYRLAVLVEPDNEVAREKLAEWHEFISAIDEKRRCE
jgi:tetratricopeptide (TPR) repeat protein